jgi:hypothetical protein
MVWVEFKRFIVPFLIVMFQVLTGALALGLLPALWILIRGQRWRLVIKWSFAAVVCIAAAAYALPLALQAWKEAALKNHGWRNTGMLVGYGIALLFAPMIIPEPLRAARRRLRNETRDRSSDKVRRKRRKRRSQQLPGEMRIR